MSHETPLLLKTIPQAQRAHQAIRVQEDESHSKRQRYNLLKDVGKQYLSIL
jgi:hypothetical protein